MNSAPSIDVHKRADSLVVAFARAGYTRVSPAILQPAEPFFDLSGEDMRRHMYLVTDTAGHEFCLRPDLTIPVARDYLASATAPQRASFCYLGPAPRAPERPALLRASSALRRALSGHCIASREVGEGAGVCMELEGRSFCNSEVRILSPQPEVKALNY